MADERQTLTDDQLDAILRTTGAQLDLPPMADAAARARAQIELRSNWGRQGEGRSVVVPFPTESVDAPASPALPVEPIGRERGSRLRDLALLAAGLAAAAILIVVLTLVFRGFDEDGTGDVASGPLAAEPYEIPGFEFLGAFGRPMVPNEPVDVAVGPDGTLFVLDAALNRVIAYDQDGEIKADWGDEGFSRRIRGATSLGAGPNGEVYVVADQVYILGPDGQESDAWPISPPPDTGEDSGLWDFVNQGVAVDSMGNVYVTKRATIWKYEPDGGLPVAIEPGMGEGIHVQIDSQDRLYALSIEGEIRRVNPDGTTELVADLSSRLGIVGFTVGPDDSIIALQPSTSMGGTSAFLRLDAQGNVLARWEMDRAGSIRGAAGTPVFIGIAIDADGTVILPDPLAHRVAFYDAGGAFVRQIKDSSPDAFGRLWRISVDGAGNVFGYDPSVVDAKVLKFSPGGELLLSASLDDDSLRVLDTVYYSSGFTATADGGFIIADLHRSRVVVYSPSGELVEEWGGTMDPLSDSGLAFPHAIAADERGYLYIVDEGFSGRLVENLRQFTVDGEFVAELGSISDPARADIAVHDDAVWAVENGGIMRFPLDGGEPEQIAAPGFVEGGGVLPGAAWTLALDSEGNVYTYLLVSDSERASFSGALAKLDSEGNLHWTAELAPEASGRYVDLAIAPNGTLYLADSELRQILAYRPSGEPIDSATPEPEPTATAEPESAYVPAGNVPDLLIVERVASTDGPTQFGVYDPASGELVDLPAGELVGISPDGGTLLLIDREPGEEWLRLDLFAVSTETWDELWRTDIGELAQLYPNTIYYDTVVAGDTVYVAVHDPDYRGELLQIAEVRLSDGFMRPRSARGMDTDIGELTDPSVEVELLPSPPNKAPKVTSFIRAPDENRTTIQSVLGPGYDHRLTELVPLGPGERYLLPDGEGLFNMPHSGYTTDPAIEYVMFEDVTTGRIELPFESVQADGGAIVEYVLSHDGRRLYALSRYDQQLGIIDLERLELVALFELSDVPTNTLSADVTMETVASLYTRHPTTVSPDGRYIYALGMLKDRAVSYAPTVWKIDTSTWAVVDEFVPEDGSGVPLSLHSNHDGSRLYVGLGLRPPSINEEGALETGEPGMLVLDTESLAEVGEPVDLDGNVVLGTLADFYREFHGLSPSVAGAVPR